MNIEAKMTSCGTFVWGSFQYQTAAIIYSTLCLLETQHPRVAILKGLNIRVTKVALINKVFRYAKKDLLGDLKIQESDGDDTTCERIQLEEASDITELLHYLRDQAWDLWEGAPYVAKLVFPNLDLNDLPEETGLGDAFNILIQNIEYDTGVSCWLLKSYGFVADDEPFKEWST